MTDPVYGPANAKLDFNKLKTLTIRFLNKLDDSAVNQTNFQRSLAQLKAAVEKSATLDKFIAIKASTYEYSRKRTEGNESSYEIHLINLLVREKQLEILECLMILNRQAPTSISWTNFSNCLIDAIMTEDDAIIDLILENNADKPTNCTTPLISAAKRGQIATVKKLLDRGAEVNQMPSSDKYKTTALMETLKGLIREKTNKVLRDNLIAVIDLLLAADGVNVDLGDVREVKRPNHVKGKSVEVLSYVPATYPILLAVKTGVVHIIQSIIDRGVNVDIQENTDMGKGSSALMIAAVLGLERTVQILLNSDCRLNLLNHDNMTALGYAVQSGNVNIVQNLLNRGALVEVALPIKHSYETKKTLNAIDIAVNTGKIEIVELLYQAYTYSGKNYWSLKSFQPVHSMTVPECNATIKWLLKHNYTNWKTIMKAPQSLGYGLEDILSNMIFSGRSGFNDVVANCMLNVLREMSDTGRTIAIDIVTCTDQLTPRDAWDKFKQQVQIQILNDADVFTYSDVRAKYHGAAKTDKSMLLNEMLIKADAENSLENIKEVIELYQKVVFNPNVRLIVSGYCALGKCFAKLNNYEQLSFILAKIASLPEENRADKVDAMFNSIIPTVQNNNLKEWLKTINQNYVEQLRLIGDRSLCLILQMPALPV